MKLSVTKWREVRAAKLRKAIALLRPYRDYEEVAAEMEWMTGMLRKFDYENLLDTDFPINTSWSRANVGGKIARQRPLSAVEMAFEVQGESPFIWIREH